MCTGETIAYSLIHSKKIILFWNFKFKIIILWKNTVNNWPVVIGPGNRLKKIWKSTEAFFWISPEADRRSAEGDIQKKAECLNTSYVSSKPALLLRYYVMSVYSVVFWIRVKDWEFIHIFAYTKLSI